VMRKLTSVIRRDDGGSFDLGRIEVSQTRTVIFLS